MPVIVGLTAADANYGVARALRRSAAEDAAIRLPYVHNLGDTLVSLAPVVAGALTIASGSFLADQEVVWPENVTCGHGSIGATSRDSVNLSRSGSTLSFGVRGGPRHRRATRGPPSGLRAA